VPRSQFATLQEEIVYTFSEHILGKQTLFCPETYGHSKEPADIAWIANRCAILMYATHSKKRFETKRDHNLRQLRRWLHVWRNGQPLIGKSGSQSLEIRFDDIDHVVGLSIVDGGETHCQYHSDIITRSQDLKLSACATLTGTVIRKLAELGFGPRDIVYWLSRMQSGQTDIVAESDLISSVRDYVAATTMSLWNQFGDLKPYEYREKALRETSTLLAWAKNGLAEQPAIGSIGADLMVADTMWFAWSKAALESLIAAPGETGPLVVGSKRETGIYRLTTVAAASMRHLNENLPKVLPPDIPGIFIFTTFDLGKEAPIRTGGFNPRTGPSQLELELTALRKASLQFSSSSPKIP
jgi:hypothetical protein